MFGTDERYSSFSIAEFEDINSCINDLIQYYIIQKGYSNSKFKYLGIDTYKFCDFFISHNIYELINEDNSSETVISVSFYNTNILNIYYDDDNKRFEIVEKVPSLVHHCLYCLHYLKEQHNKIKFSIEKNEKEKIKQLEKRVKKYECV